MEVTVKRLLIPILTAVVLIMSLVVLSVSPASAARLPGEPVPGCQFRQWPPGGIHFMDSFNFWYTTKYRTSNGTCPGDGVRFYLRRWSENSTVCGRVWLRTYNNDGTVRRVWPSQEVCPGREVVFLNADNQRWFRYEIRVNSNNQESWNVPSGTGSF